MSRWKSRWWAKGNKPGMLEQTQMSDFHGQLFCLTYSKEPSGPLVVIRTLFLSPTCSFVPLQAIVLWPCQLRLSFTTLFLVGTRGELIEHEQILLLLLPPLICWWFFTLGVQESQRSLVCNFAAILEAVVSKMQKHSSAFSEIWALHGCRALWNSSLSGDTHINWW